MVRILLADDHQMFIDGIKAFLENEKSIEVVGEALNGIEVLHFLKANKVDVIVLDISMPKMDGFETIKEIKRNNTKVKILVVTTYGDGEHVHKMLSHGAEGYLIKNKSKEELVNAILNIHNNQRYISLDILDAYLNYIQKKSTVPKSDIHLTKREREVLILIAQGFQDKEIAEKLNIIETTVYTHSRNLRKKIGVSNRTELSIYARDYGIVEP